MESKPLFENVADEGGNNQGAGSGEAILLVDCSGSTQGQFDDGKKGSIFDKFSSLAQELPHENYRIIFWSSINHQKGNFVNGIMSLPFVVKKAAIKSTFLLARPNVGGCTQPHIAFQAIRKEWLANDPIVYFMTDGQYDSDTKSKFTKEIQTVGARLVIISVENSRTNMADLEKAAQAAGSDVYRLIQENNLTKRVMRFVSHNLSGEFVQFSRTNAPPGYIPFGNSYFSETRIGEFIQFIKQKLIETNADETKQLEIAQQLSITLEQVTKDKPKKVADDIVRTFSSLFSIDKNVVNYILSDAIERERQGKAGVFANYRAELKNLFQQAEQLLKKDVFSSIGGGQTDSFFSAIIPTFSSSAASGRSAEGRILTGSFRLIDKTISSHGNEYPRGGFSSTVPVFPLLTEKLVSTMPEIQQQCARQWVRTVYSALFGTHPTSDEIIYLVMGHNILVNKSSFVSREIKEAYRCLTRIMLNKKRSNSIAATEYDRLAEGEAPVPNSGKIDDLYKLVNTVGAKLGITATPLCLWYNMCLAFDANIADKQKKHCGEDYKGTLEFVGEIRLDTVPNDTTYDYSCLVTLDDISAVGGFRILPHMGAAGQCNPVYIFSSAGKDTMLASAFCACPVCYNKLDARSFEAVGPKTIFELDPTYTSEQLASKFRAVVVAAARGGNDNNAPAPGAGRNGGAMTNANGKKGSLVILKGVVGSGKSTASARIAEIVKARGGSVYVEGTDKYCKDGISPKIAVDRVKQSLNSISQDANDDIVVVIDTCGENTSAKEYTIFGVNFSGWKKVDIFANLDKQNMKGYFAWSLRNVLKRGVPNADSSHYLNPVSAGVQTCIDVHKKKAQKLFQKNMKEWTFDGSTVASLTPLADEYEKDSLAKFQLPAI